MGNRFFKSFSDKFFLHQAIHSLSLQAINIGDIVQGRVTDKWADLLYIRILSVYLGPKRWIADLKVKVWHMVLSYLSIRL